MRPCCVSGINRHLFACGCVSVDHARTAGVVDSDLLPVVLSFSEGWSKKR